MIQLHLERVQGIQVLVGILPVRMLATQKPPSRWHTGERQVQQRLGIHAQMEPIGHMYIRTSMPDQHREFWKQLVTFYISSQDSQSRVWGSILVGKPGFVSSQDDTHLLISPFKLMHGDGGRYEVGTYVGCLGIELHTRRRNRVNGHIVEKSDDSILIKVDQSFGNCPKYIQGRQLELDESSLAEYGNNGEVLSGEVLGNEQINIIKKLDTLFIGSGHVHNPDSSSVSPLSSGLDMSHRGGHPGFVEVVDEQHLVFPDYRGNNFYNTFGNLIQNPRAGLLFPNFATGDVIQVTGEAEVDFDDKKLPGSLRTVKFTIAAFIHVKGVLPLSFGTLDPSPYNRHGLTGTVGQTLICLSARKEAEGVKTFEFSMPVDDKGKALSYQPGQFATFDITGLEGSDITNRTWTVSSHPSESDEGFKITVKKMGLASNWLHDCMHHGRGILFRGFGGDFIPVKNNTHDPRTPVLLLAGGIGITPLRSMCYAFSSAGTDTILIYSTRNLGEAAFLKELQNIAHESEGNIKLFITTTGKEKDWDGLKGRVDKKLLEKCVRDASKRDVYMCGPISFMDSVERDLESLGCQSERIYRESFAF